MIQVSNFIGWGSSEEIESEINEWIELTSKDDQYSAFKIIDIKFNTNIVKDGTSEEREVTEYNVMVVWEYYPR